MKKILFIHAVIEMMAGIALIFKPELLLMVDGQVEQTLVAAKMYGIMAFTLGIISYMMYKMFRFDDIFKRIILILMAFHLMIALQMYAAFTQGNIPNLGPFGLHIVLALLFLVGYMRDPKAFSE